MVFLAWWWNGNFTWDSVRLLCGEISIFTGSRNEKPWEKAYHYCSLIWTRYHSISFKLVNGCQRDIDNTHVARQCPPRCRRQETTVVARATPAETLACWMWFCALHSTDLLADRSHYQTTQFCLLSSPCVFFLSSGTSGRKWSPRQRQHLYRQDKQR